MNGKRTGRRSALRGLSSAAAALAFARLSRGATRRWGPISPEMAAGAGFVAGVGLELPAAVVPLGVAGGVVGWAHISGDASHTVGIVAGAGLGVAVALGSRRLWPVAPRGGADLRTVRTASLRDPIATGSGVAVLVNPSSGPGSDRDPVEELRNGLPDATVVELGEGDDLVAALEKLAAGAAALGVAGGDGSLNAGAGVAHEHDLPLLAVPSGTLNHFARDLGVESVAEAVEAVREGQVAAVDLACIDGRPFLNTASFGSYVELVDARERLEERIGKWPALVVALVGVLRRGEPLEVELDGRRRLIWMAFIGNCRYHPSGFAPSWRARLDDGDLDIRVVEAGEPWSRTRLVLAVLTGRLGRCRVYEQRWAPELRVRSLNGALRLARDGETFDGPAEFLVTKYDRPLTVYAPPG